MASENPTVPFQPSPNPGTPSPAGGRAPASDLPTSDFSGGHADAPLSGEFEAATSFADYELLGEIARGGMGVVYRARQKSLNRVVALKMILSGRFASSGDVRRFQLEAEAAANLDHPGIVPIYEIGEQEGHHYFSMKLVEGGSLADKLPELRERPRDFVALMSRVASAIHHAHQRGVLHRDLKPTNILLNPEGRPLVSDLGLAKQITGDSDLTNTGAAIGTPAYMPPEQAAGSKEITTAVDIFALGAMLYEGLTGRPPYQGETPVKLLVKALEGEIAPPREFDSRVDRTLAQIAMKCLRREPNERYHSAAALAEDLQRWLRGDAVSIGSPSFGSTVTRVLQDNLRSAAGAAVIGLVAGVAFAWCMGRAYSAGDIRDNPPLAIYRALPAEIPLGRSLAFQNESASDPQTALFAGLGILAIIAFAGILVARTTHAKPGREAFSFGLIAAVFMAIATFSLSIGFGVIADTHNDSRSVIALLTDAAFGSAERSAKAREVLRLEYPRLEELPEQRRGSTLAYRVYYDGVYAIPVNMALGIVFSSVLCLIPCVSGTTFASKLLHEQNAWRWKAPAYLEFMVATTGLTLLLFAATIALIVEAKGEESAQEFLLFAAISGALLVTLLAFLYRRSLTWRGRLLAYGLPLAGVLLFAMIA